MAGLLHTRSIPTLLAVQMAAVIRGQVHECSCGHKQKGESRDSDVYAVPNCDECGEKMFPAYNVHDSRGRVVGEVCGLSHSDAMESVSQSPQFDRLNTRFTVSPKIWGQR